MKRLIDEFLGWVKGISLVIFLSGLWVIPIVIFIVYKISTSNLPDWFKFWLLN